MEGDFLFYFILFMSIKVSIIEGKDEKKRGRMVNEMKKCHSEVREKVETSQFLWVWKKS